MGRNSNAKQPVGGESPRALVRVDRCRTDRPQVDSIQEQVQRVTQELEEVMCGRNGRGYLTLLCIGLEAHYQQGTPAKGRDYVMNREIKLRKIQKALEKYRTLQEDIDGIDGNRNRIDEVIGTVRQVIDWMDDVIWNAMVDPAHTVQRFRAEELKFQIDSI
ncbi:hypothetical protein H1R20_g9040, partial [Candolleomyces eurysporus]